MSTVPNWVIAQKLMPGGRRLPKFKKFVEPVKSYPSYQTGWTNWDRSKGASLVTYSGDKPLSTGDFRYWQGVLSKSQNANYSTCRCCGMVAMSPDLRRIHLKAGSCGLVLTRAYEKLRRDNVCVICDLPTRVKHWGLALCCKDCKFNWQYVTRQPTSLLQAIRLVRAETGKIFT